MNIPAAVLAGLHLLDEVLDARSSGTHTTLTVLTSEAALAVSSFLGLTVLIPRAGETPLQIRTFETDPGAEAVGASLRFRVRGDSSGGADGPAVIELILYAARAGAFVDLAADLTWLTGRPWDDFRVDEDLDGPQDGSVPATLASWSSVNQARGVLIGSGLTVEEADSEMDARAVATGTSRALVAAEILARLSGGEPPAAL